MIPLRDCERHIKIYIHYYVHISDVDAPLGLYGIKACKRVTLPLLKGYVSSFEEIKVT